MTEVEQICQILDRVEDSVLPGVDKTITLLTDAGQDSFISKSFPTYKELSNRETFIANYSEITQMSYKCSQALAGVCRNLSNLRILRDKFSSFQLAPSLQSLYTDRIKKYIEELREDQQVLLHLKDALDYANRFYASVNYMLFNPRSVDSY